MRAFIGAAYLQPFWSRLAGLNLNTVLVPVYWDLVEPQEGRFVAGKWENVRWLGGDETHQGRHVRLEPARTSIQRVRLYAY
jgi:hypothetical protein